MVNKKKIQVFDINNDIQFKNTLKTLNDKNFSEGKNTNVLLNKFKNFNNKKYAIAFPNWTIAMYLAIKVLTKYGDKVVVPNNTFIASSNSVIANNLNLLICDTDNNFEYNYDLLEKICLVERPNFVMVVPLYGRSFNLDKILYLKKKYNFQIFEDSAQGFSSRYNSKIKCGSLGIFGGFSLYPNKVLTSGEGGILLTNNRKLYYDLKVYKNHGRSKKGSFKHPFFGLNFCFNDILASFCLDHLKYYQTDFKKRKMIYNYYKENLKSNKFEILNHNKFSNYWLNILIFNNSNLKNIYKKKLEENNIEVRDLFFPLESQPCYKNTKKNITLYIDNSYKKLYKKSFIIPSNINLNLSNLKTITKILNS